MKRHDHYSALGERRKMPGHCKHCGRAFTEEELQKEGRWNCQHCLRQQSRRRKAFRLKRKQIAETVCPESFAMLVKKVNALTVALEHTRNKLHVKYRQGKEAGMIAAQREALKAAAKVVTEKPWDSWEQELDMDERKRQFHRFAAACGGDK